MLFSLVLTIPGCPSNGEKPPDPLDHPYPVRECMTKLVFDDGRNYGRVTVAGSFNGWSETADRLEKDEDSTAFSIDLNLKPGEYAYKFLVDGNWAFDPSNMRTVFHGGLENSRLIVPDCTDPMIRLQQFEVNGPEGSVQLSFQYVDGAELYGLDTDSVIIKLNRSILKDTDAAFDFNYETGFFSVSISGLSTGKHLLEVEAGDTTGGIAEPLFLPFWIEDDPFSWDGAIMYFAFVDRFRNGNPSLDDPVPDSPWLSNYQGGDFRGLKDAIEEGWFDELGVEAIWITAPQQNPDGRWPGDGDTTHTGYHGYWPSAPRDTQPRFGSIDDLRDMIAAAHKRGIRVLADVVLNHVHESHPHWRLHREDGWFIGDGDCVCGRTCDWEAQAVECWFTPYLPVYDWKNTEVLKEVMDDVMWWVKETNLDGFRVDAVKHFERVALRNLRASLAEIESNSPVDYLLMGETFTGDGGHGDIAAYIDRDQLHGQFDFPLYWPLARVIARYESNFFDLDAAVLAGETLYPEGAVMGPFMGNHDVPRFYSHAAGDIGDVWGSGAKEQGWNNPPGSHDWDIPYNRMFLGFAFILTQPGMPLIYYGDEVGLPGAGDPDNRRFMPWGNEITARGAGLLEKVRKLGQLRAQTGALRHGDRQSLLVHDDVYAYSRNAGNGDFAVIVINRADTPRTVNFELPGDLSLIPRLTMMHRLKEGTETVESGRLNITVGAMSAVILTPAE